MRGADDEQAATSSTVYSSQAQPQTILRPGGKHRMLPLEIMIRSLVLLAKALSRLLTITTSTTILVVIVLVVTIAAVS